MNYWRVLLMSLLLTLAELASGEDPTVGREGRLAVVLPRGDLQALPVVGRPTLVLRIATCEATGDGFLYDLRFQGAVPGTFNLTDYLLKPDGAPASELPKIPVTVRGILSVDHDGSLFDAPAMTSYLFGHYQTLMIALIVGWAALLPWLWRRRQKPAVLTVQSSAPTLAERFAPLVIQAQAGTLDSVGLAHLERLLIATWRKQLGLDAIDYRAALAQLRADEHAGALLRQVDLWLHARPGTSTSVDVTTLLAPYRSISAQVTA